MKTALKALEMRQLSFIAATLSLALFAASFSSAGAVDMPPAPPAVMPPPVAGAQTTQVSPVPTPAAAPAAPDATPAPLAADDPNKAMPPGTDSADAASSDKAEKGKKSLTAAEDKVSESVKGVVKRLGTTENMTLDDLNSARQAVAKIEALIDIEKHLNELEKLRSDREGRGMSGGAIPVSALTAMQQQPQFQAAPQPPMPMPSAMAASMMMPQQPSFSPVSSLEVTRVIGSGDHYKAIIKMPDGQTKTVAVGDHVEGLGIIKAITSMGVELDQNGTKHVIHVKNVDTVFSAAP